MKLVRKASETVLFQAVLRIIISKVIYKNDEIFTEVLMPKIILLFSLVSPRLVKPVTKLYLNKVNKAAFAIANFDIVQFFLCRRTSQPRLIIVAPS